MRLPTIEMDSYSFDCGEERNRESPESFSIPSKDLRENLKIGNCVKLIFRMLTKDNEIEVERMWVDVTDKIGEIYTGTLNNEPHANADLAWEDVVYFEARHVIAIYE